MSSRLYFAILRDEGTAYLVRSLPPKHGGLCLDPQNLQYEARCSSVHTIWTQGVRKSEAPWAPWAAHLDELAGPGSIRDLVSKTKLDHSDRWWHMSSTSGLCICTQTRPHMPAEYVRAHKYIHTQTLYIENCSKIRLVFMRNLCFRNYFYSLYRQQGNWIRAVLLPV